MADASGNGNTGTISGATWAGTGKFGKALMFNGTSARVTITDSPSLDLTTGMTLEAWVNPATSAGAWRDVIYKGSDAYFLEASSSKAGVPGGGGTFGGLDMVVYGPSVIPAGSWSHLALTYDGAAIRLYVNGVQVASGSRSGTIITSTNPLQIGGDNLFGQFFHGMIDEVRVYNRALSAAQIQSDMNTAIGTGSAGGGSSGGSTPPPPPPTTPPPSGLVAAYGFNEGTGSTVPDVSGNGNTATIVGSTWTSQGRFEGAMSFDGSGDYIVINDSSSIDVTSGMTLEAWVYPTGFSVRWQDVIFKDRDMYYLEAVSPRNAPAAGGTFAGGALYGAFPAPRQHLESPGRHLRPRHHPALRERGAGREPRPDGADRRLDGQALHRRRRDLRTELPGPDRRGPDLQPRAVRSRRSSGT